MKLLICPVSGGGFPVQISVIKKLSKLGFKPDLTLASSGGNISSYIASAADWDFYGIERICKQIHKNIFSKKWLPINFISNIYGFFKKTMYDRGDGCEEFFQEIFTIETIKKYEIWTGIYNEGEHKSTLFCNLTSQNSILKIKDINLEMTQSTLPIFCNGDINLISKFCLASASIPGLVPSVNDIGGKKYIDGGVGNASPLVILKRAIDNYVIENDTPLHIFYLNSFNFNEPVDKKIRNVIDILSQAGSNLVRSHTTIDRLGAFELIENKIKNVVKIEFLCNYENLSMILNYQKKIKFSMLEFFPDNYKILDIINFENEELIDKIKEIDEKLNCRFWFEKTEDKNDLKMFEKIVNI